VKTFHDEGGVPCLGGWNPGGLGAKKTGKRDGLGPVNMGGAGPKARESLKKNLGGGEKKRSGRGARPSLEIFSRKMVSGRMGPSRKNNKWKGHKRGRKNPDLPHLGRE